MEDYTAHVDLLTGTLELCFGGVFGKVPKFLYGNLHGDMQAHVCLEGAAGRYVRQSTVM